MSSEVGENLGDYVSLVRGTTYKGNLVGKPGPALLGLGSITPGGGFREEDFKTYGGDCPEKLMLVPGDLFASLKGATKDGKMIGSVARVPTSVPLGRLTQDTVKLCFKRGNQEVESYIYWLLQTPEYRAYCAGRAMGSAVVALSREDFLSYPVPELSHARRAVVDLLETIESRMRLLRQTNTTLEAIAQSLFKSWFVDFDPVRAKMAGRAPEGMDEATAALFPDAMEETELGLVPKGWSLRPFMDAVDVIGGGTPKTSNSDYWGGEIPWFSVVDAPDGADTFVIDTEKHITDAGLRGSSTKLLPQGTTIISARGTVGKLALTGRPMAMNQSCYGLRGKAGDAYFTYFSTCHLVEALKARSHGSVFDTITRDTLVGVHSLLPANTDVINAFENAVSPLMSRVLLNLHQSSGLAELRDTLLPRLISGQLRLPEAKAQLEAMA